jgi:hypothetical protein
MWLIPISGICDDSKLDQVLGHFARDQQGVFNYQETRHLELVSTPWHGEGLMLTASDGSLVKLQLQPERIIMAISGDNLYYWHPAQNQRHNMPISFGEDAARQILIFRQILQGQLSSLQQQYDLTADSDGQHWTLQLRPKPSTEQLISAISISGNQQQRQIVIQQSDGESSEYRIEKADPQITAQYSISQLLQEASGE